VRRAAALVPSDRALIETDSPYLAPEPYRGEDNRPALVPRNGAALAGVWDTDVATVAAHTATNAARVFGSPG
jgi:TatD DNase family protein